MRAPGAPPHRIADRHQSARRDREGDDPHGDSVNIVAPIEVLADAGGHAIFGVPFESRGAV